MTTAPIPIEREPPIRRVLYPITAFIRAEASGGVVLIGCAVIALIWANSPWAGTYERLWATTLTIGPLSKTLHHWINDGLMTIFFFVVGLEIKREALVGELAVPRLAVLPIIAALSGMVLPAALYAVINFGGEGLRGWGVPMATDIAFALGVLALLGRRVPASLKVFLTALAIIDDIGAVLVIALFYTRQVSLAALGVAVGFLVALITANRLHVRHLLVYVGLGIGLWIAVLESGIHATIAGVLLALTIPARTRVDTEEFLHTARRILHDFDRADATAPKFLANAGQQAAIAELEELSEGVQTPLQRLEHALHPWVAFGIVPLFALANAGVVLDSGFGVTLKEPVALGVLVGLLLGKQLGITRGTWLAVRAGFAALPEGVKWGHLYGVSWLAGIGFTMSLFIVSLAFDERPLLAAAKVGILTASLIAGVIGWGILRATSVLDNVRADGQVQGGE